jgi:selenocysteine-specific elongation factor
MKRIIVGTAGHIDHGKTALVKALTNVDTDRLKEEKERGITIDIGFADLALDSVHFGIVDVPGHERFVRNMLAGVHGIDLVLLIIAADEGIMPQTREHFDICRLLQVKAGIIVLTKSDLADPDLHEIVFQDTLDFVRGSFLEGAPVISVSSKTGAGIDDLKTGLLRAAAAVEPRDGKAVARLPVDRVFTAKGFGTVVTGTLISGNLRIGDEMEIVPGNRKRSRIRGLQVHGNPTSEAHAGERTAVNLQGISLEEVSRGQVVASSGRFLESSLLDVELEVLSSAPRALRSRAKVRLHIGTAEVLARVVFIGQTELLPGSKAFAQLRLESPVLALPADRFIIRLNSPALTIGGGRVLDGLPSKHRARNSALALDYLHHLARADGTLRIATFIDMSADRGLTHDELAARSGSSDQEISEAIDQLVADNVIVRIDGQPPHFISRKSFELLGRSALELIDDYHKAHPLEAGMGREELRERLFATLPTVMFRAVIAHGVEKGQLVLERDLVRLKSHKVELAENELRFKERLSELYLNAGLNAGLNPVPLDEGVEKIAGELDITPQRGQAFARMLLSMGVLVPISDTVFHRQALDDLIERVRQFKRDQGSRIDVAAFKDLAGLSRKYAIPLLEYLDRVRVTRRAGNEREIL